MAFSSISNLAIAVGSAIKAELWSKVKNNFDDLNTRLNNVEGSSSKIPIIKFFVLNGSQFSTGTGLYYWESNDNFTITSAYVQIFEKGSLTGTFEVDIKKSTTDLNSTSFTTIFTTKPSLDFSSIADYAKSTNQVFDPTKVSMVAGNLLRFDITQMPAGGVMSKFLITVYGE
jgi:hypothetical protein